MKYKCLFITLFATFSMPSYSSETVVSKRGDFVCGDRYSANMLVDSMKDKPHGGRWRIRANAALQVGADFGMDCSWAKVGVRINADKETDYIYALNGGYLVRFPKERDRF